MDIGVIVIGVTGISATGIIATIIITIIVEAAASTSVSALRSSGTAMAILARATGIAGGVADRAATAVAAAGKLKSGG